MKIKAGLPATLFMGLSTILSAQPTAASSQSSGIRGIDFLNHSYQTSVCSEDVGLPRPVKVRDGKFKDSDANFFDVNKDEMAYGDVNGDGSEDAVVFIRCGSSVGTLRAFEVHAYSLQGGQAKLLARLDSTGVEGDYKKSYPDGVVFYPGETGPKIVNGHVIVEALTDGSFAGPENVATFDYQLSGGKFVLSGKPTRVKKIYDDADSLATRGTLQVGKTESVILYFGEESGDYAAYCFANDSVAGRAILAACKNGEQCEFSGDVNYEGGCKVPGLEADLSASGRVLKIESVKSLGSKPSDSQAGSQGEAYTPAPQTAERKAIADALRVPVEKKLKKSVVFKIDHLKVRDGWASYAACPSVPTGSRWSTATLHTGGRKNSACSTTR